MHGGKNHSRCTSETGSAERRRNAFSRALMKGVGRNTRGPASEGSPWGAHRGGCTVGLSSGPQRGLWSSALASGARVVSVRYQGGTTLLPVWYQSGTRLVPDWCQNGTRLVPDHRVPLHFAYMSPVPEAPEFAKIRGQSARPRGLKLY